MGTTSLNGWSHASAFDPQNAEPPAINPRGYLDDNASYFGSTAMVTEGS